MAIDDLTGLTPAQVEFFDENGYLVVENVLGDNTLDSLWQEYTVKLDSVATLLNASGKLSSDYADLDFDKRYIAMMAESSDVFQHLEISYPLLNENFPSDVPIHCGETTFKMLTDSRLLDVVESIIGPEIYSNPVQHIRLKPPYKAIQTDISKNSYVGKTTWHQDQGALLDEANDTQVLTTWIAITDCPEERGCLIAVPKSHKRHELSIHCPGDGIASENYIPESLLADDTGKKDFVTLPCKRGSVVLLNQFTQHAALENSSDVLRWSFDLRWNKIGQATGRPAFPGFIARSRSNPESELRDHKLWAELWETAKDRLVNGDYTGQVFNAERWSKYVNAPVCA